MTKQTAYIRIFNGRTWDCLGVESVEQEGVARAALLAAGLESAPIRHLDRSVGAPDATTDFYGRDTDRVLRVTALPTQRAPFTVRRPGSTAYEEGLASLAAAQRSHKEALRIGAGEGCHIYDADGRECETAWDAGLLTSR